MGDRISMLPDEVLCYILSFLPTKVAVATSVLSKRWKPLWRSVPAFDFDSDDYRDKGMKGGTNYKFLYSMTEFLRTRDPLQSLRIFTFRLSFACITRIPHPTNLFQLVSDAAVQHKLERLSIFLSSDIPFPSVIFSCKTLVELTLIHSNIEAFSSVDLPSLKIMLLCAVTFSEDRFLADLLSGCPNLEDMSVTRCYGCPKPIISYSATQLRFKILPKLVRAALDKRGFIPLQVVSNAHFLCIEAMDRKEEIIEDLIPHFHSLTRLELTYNEYNKNWLEVFKVLNHCPKLQYLFIDQDCNYDYDRMHWQYPPCVPRCISSHLITCRITCYEGYEDEFEFARYIMQNAKVLKKMVIRTSRGRHRRSKEKRLIMRKKLSLFSSTCKLSFK